MSINKKQKIKGNTNSTNIVNNVPAQNSLRQRIADILEHISSPGKLLAKVIREHGFFTLFLIVLSLVVGIYLGAVHIDKIPMVNANLQAEFSLAKSIRLLGLEKLEIRDNTPGRTNAPEEFIKISVGEILVTGISGNRTFDEKNELILKQLEDGKRVYALLLDPDSIEIPSINLREKRRIDQDIRTTLSAMKSRGLIGHPGFKVRLMEKMPPFTGLMIDGNIETTGKSAADTNGKIRIQPSRQFGIQSKGIILQMVKLENNSSSMFDFFAEDFRLQWAKAKEPTDSSFFPVDH